MASEGKISTIGDRFELCEQIAHSSFSRVYAAVDLVNGERVALKLIGGDALHPENLMRLRMEIDTLAMIDDPGVVKIRENGLEKAATGYPRAFVAMEFVEGTTLDTLRERPLSVSRAVGLATAICRALIAVHARGIIHGDLKPANIMVTDAPGGKIKLIDFGLARFKRAAANLPTDKITGTFQYMAPEQIGLLHRPVDERSDLYSLGLILYQQLCGRFPFKASSLTQLLQAQIAQIPVPPSRHIPAIEPVLDEVVGRLLSKEPAQRYQSAQGLLHDLESYLKGERRFRIGVADIATRRAFFSRFIGRTVEMEHLRRRYRRLKAGVGSICFLLGPAGSGKTRLLEEFRHHLLTGGVRSIEARSLQRNGRIPRQLWTELLSEYAKRYQLYNSKRRTNIATVIRKRFREVGRVLIDLQPHLHGILGRCPPVTRLEPEKETLRICLLTTSFLSELATAEKGLVVLLEDVHWADRSSLEFLVELSRMVEKVPLLVVATARVEEVDDNPQLQALISGTNSHHTEILRIMAFDAQAITALVTDALDGDEGIGRTLGDFIHRRSHGNPLHALALLAHLAEHGIVSRHRGKWRLKHQSLASAPIPQELLDVMLNGLGRLSAAQKDLFSIAAAIGKTVAIDLLMRVVPESTGDIWPTVNAALRRGLMEELPQTPGKVAFVHDRIRDAFYGRLSPQAAREAHNRIGKALEAVGGGAGEVEAEADQAIFSLAHHFIAAEDKDKILEYAIPAARAANAAYAYHEAIRYLQAVAAVLDPEDSLSKESQVYKTLLSCRQSLAEAYINAGRAVDAQDILPDLIKRTNDKTRLTRLYLLQTRAFIGVGSYGQSEAPARAGLRLLKEHLPAGPVGIVLGTLRQWLTHLVLPLVPTFWPRADTRAVETARLKFSFYLHLFWTYHMGSAWKVPRTILRMVNISRRTIGPSRELGLALLYYALIGFITRRHRGAFAYIEKARSVATHLGDEWLLAGCDRLTHICLGAKGAYAASLPYGRNSLAYFQRTGEFTEAITLIQGISYAHFELGQMERALTFCKQACRIARNRAEKYMVSTFGFPAIVYISRGQYRAALDNLLPLLDSDEDLQYYQFGSCLVNIYLGRVYCELGDTKRSLACFEAADQLNRANKFIQYLLIPLHYYYAEAVLKDYYRRKDTLIAGERRQCLRRVRRLCFQARRKSRVYPSHYGCAMQATAGYWVARGRTARAQKWYRRAIDHYRRYDQRYKEGRAFYALGRFLDTALDRIAGNEAAHKAFATAYRIFGGLEIQFWQRRAGRYLGLAPLAEEPPGVPIDRAKRDAIMAFGRDLSAVDNLPAIMDRALEKGMEVTGACAGGIFLSRTGQGSVTLRASRSLEAEGTFAYSQGIVDTVFKTGQPLLCTNARQDDALELYASVSRERLRSVVCLPLCHNQLVNGVYYLHNPLVCGLFTASDLEYLEYLLSPAAVAIENALLQQKLAGPPTKTVPGATPPADTRLAPVLTYLKQHFDENVTREQMAELAGVSSDYLGKLFKNQVGKSIRDYLNELRLQSALELLAATDKKIVDIAFETGFESLRTFNRLFTRAMGDSPSAYRKKLTLASNFKIEKTISKR